MTEAQRAKSKSRELLGIPTPGAQVPLCFLWTHTYPRNSFLTTTEQRLENAFLGRVQLHKRNTWASPQPESLWGSSPAGKDLFSQSGLGQTTSGTSTAFKQSKGLIAYWTCTQADLGARKEDLCPAKGLVLTSKALTFCMTAMAAKKHASHAHRGLPPLLEPKES